MAFVLETLTPATLAPLTAADVAAHLRLNDTGENGMVADWITAAADLWERDTQYALLTTAYRLSLDSWPSGPIYLPRKPVQAVASVQYLDTAGAWQTLTGYTTDTATYPARIVTAGLSLPQLHPTARPAVRVQFTAGHTQAADVPKLVTAALKLVVAHWWTHREAFTDGKLTDLPHGWKAVADSYRMYLLNNWWEG